MLVAFARYSCDGSFRVLREHRRFVAVMAGGSVVGTVAGGLLLGIVPTSVLVPLLVVLLLTSPARSGSTPADVGHGPPAAATAMGRAGFEPATSRL